MTSFRYNPRSPWARFRQDRRAVLCLGLLCLEVLRTGTAGGEDLLPALEQRFPDLEIQVTVTPAVRESAPLYPGKRFIHQ